LAPAYLRQSRSSIGLRPPQLAPAPAGRLAPRNQLAQRRHIGPNSAAWSTDRGLGYWQCESSAL